MFCVICRKIKICLIRKKQMKKLKFTVSMKAVYVFNSFLHEKTGHPVQTGTFLQCILACLTINA